MDSILKTEDEVDLKDDTSHFGKLFEREDIGFLVRMDKREVVLAVSRCHEDNTVSYSNTIPRNWVKKIIYLEPLNAFDNDGGEPSTKKGERQPLSAAPPPIPSEIPSERPLSSARTPTSARAGASESH